MLSNVSIAGFASGAPADQPASRMALVMDEVDGMSSGDRGGMQALIKLIHSAKMPVGGRPPRRPFVSFVPPLPPFQTPSTPRSPEPTLSSLPHGSPII